MSEESSPFDTLLDVFVYAPVGLALVATEELPKLVARGRAQLGGQLTMAKMVGQFAVAQGRQQLAARRPPSAAPPEAGPDISPPPPATGDRMTSDDTVGVPPPRPPIPKDDNEGPPPVAGTEPPPPVVPEPSGLAIPGYDSLAASQVVPRLAGLSAEELAAVHAYESAHRARQTILNRVRQLQER